jgi:hypothetical protein
VEVVNDQGESVGSEVYTVGEGMIEYGPSNRVTMVEIPVSLPLTLPRTEWRVIATAPGGRAQTPLPLGSISPFIEGEWPFMVVSHGPSTNATNPFDPDMLAPFQPGEAIWLEGRHFEPNVSLPLGFYRGEGRLEFLGSVQVETDPEGAFAREIRLDPALPTGDYALVPLSFINGESDRVSEVGYGRFTVQAEQDRLVTDFNCDAPHRSQLTRGRGAYLGDDTANNLRMYPGLYADVTGRLLPGQEVTLLDGPECSDELLWWYVHVGDAGLGGWTVEGDDQSAWLLPVP